MQSPLLCSSGWPQTPRGPPASSSPVLIGTTPSLKFFCENLSSIRSMSDGDVYSNQMPGPDQTRFNPFPEAAHRQPCDSDTTVEEEGTVSHKPPAGYCTFPLSFPTVILCSRHREPSWGSKRCGRKEAWPVIFACALSAGGLCLQFSHLKKHEELSCTIQATGEHSKKCDACTLSP